MRLLRGRPYVLLPSRSSVAVLCGVPGFALLSRFGVACGGHMVQSCHTRSAHEGVHGLSPLFSHGRCKTVRVVAQVRASRPQLRQYGFHLESQLGILLVVCVSAHGWAMHLWSGVAVLRRLASFARVGLKLTKTLTKCTPNETFRGAGISVSRRQNAWRGDGWSGRVRAGRESCV